MLCNIAEALNCPMEQDKTWNITWPATSPHQEAKEQCPGNGK